MVTLFTAPGCVQCTMTAKELDKRKIPFQTRNVIDDKDAYDHVIGLGYRRMPVVVAGEEHWAGFRPDKLKTLVA